MISRQVNGWANRRMWEGEPEMGAKEKIGAESVSFLLLKWCSFPLQNDGHIVVRCVQSRQQNHPHLACVDSAIHMNWDDNEGGRRKNRKTSREMGNIELCHTKPPSPILWHTTWHGGRSCVSIANLLRAAEDNILSLYRELRGPAQVMRHPGETYKMWINVEIGIMVVFCRKLVSIVSTFAWNPS